jgi:hypothetical protein
MTNYLKVYHSRGAELETGERPEMEIILQYTKGGHNAFTGDTDGRGLELAFWPVQRCDGSITRTLFDSDGMRFMIYPLSRKSDKRGWDIAEILRPHTEALADLANKRDWANIRERINDLLPQARAARKAARLAARNRHA